MSDLQVTEIEDKPTGALQIGMKQLFSRSDDEMFATPEALLDYLGHRESITREIPIHSMYVEKYNDDDNLAFIVNGDEELVLNDHSFGQVCRLAKAPKDYLNRLSPELAARNLNHGLTLRGEKNGIVSNTAGNLTRAIYSSKYERMSDLTVAKEILETAIPLGYKPAGTFAGTRGGMPAINDLATGLYAGEHDLFLFLANEELPFVIDGEEFFHTVIVWNGETTMRQTGGLTSLYRFICGNHQIWGSRDTVQVQARHIGNGPRQVLDAMKRVIEGYSKYRAQVEEKFRLEHFIARNKPFADTREEVQKKLETYLNRKQSASVLPFIDSELAYPKNPHSIYGVAQGLTLYAQTMNNANARNAIEIQAGDLVAREIQ